MLSRAKMSSAVAGLALTAPRTQPSLHHSQGSAELTAREAFACKKMGKSV
jgi:hypothetical protein